MTKIYQMLFNDEGVFGVAESVDNSDLLVLPYDGIVENWHPLRLKITEGEFADYLANDLGGRLCSERLKNVLQQHASPSDELQWLPVEVKGDEENRSYAILHFPKPPDILNKNKSIYAGDFVVKPVFLKDAISRHHVFAYSKAGHLKLFVSEPVKLAIEAEGCTGIEFSEAPVK